MGNPGRQAVAEALREAGPEAPTLCEGWTTHDLAAHLVVRESRPDAMPGIALSGVPVLPQWTERVRRQYARRDYERLVDDFAAGPPRLSLFSLPGMDASGNFTEFFIHCEDVRRAQPGWRPRELSESHLAALWEAVSKGGRLMFRHSPVGVVLVVPGGPRRQVRRGAESVVLTGGPGELLLHAAGRQEHAQVEVSGPESAVRAYSGVSLGL
jgi:uncharacterized protein (TIGR03085 family)